MIINAVKDLSQYPKRRFRKRHPVLLATSFEVEADSAEEAALNATIFAAARLSWAQQAGSSSPKVTFTRTVLPMDAAVEVALQLLALENKGGEVARRASELRQEVARLSKQTEDVIAPAVPRREPI